MSISSSEIVYVGYCLKCNKMFGHKTSKTKANQMRREHLKHCIDVDPIVGRLITREIETAILQNLEEW